MDLDNMIKTSLNDSKPPDLEILPSMMCDVDSTTNNNKNVVQIVTVKMSFSETLHSIIFTQCDLFENK